MNSKQLRKLCHIARAAFERDVADLSELRSEDLELRMAIRDLIGQGPLIAVESMPLQVSLQQRWIRNRRLELQRQRAALAPKLLAVQLRTRQSFGRWQALSELCKGA